MNTGEVRIGLETVILCALHQSLLCDGWQTYRKQIPFSLSKTELGAVIAHLD